MTDECRKRFEEWSGLESKDIANGSTAHAQLLAFKAGWEARGEELFQLLETLLDPNMPAQQMRLHMGEMTGQEIRTARAVITWANSVIEGSIRALLPTPPQEGE